MDNTQTKVFMFPGWINNNIQWLQEANLSVCISHWPLSQRLSGKSSSVHRAKSMTFHLWTVWPRQADCWWEGVHERARPPRAATIGSLSYTRLTPPHDALHHQWHSFLPARTCCCSPRSTSLCFITVHHKPAFNSPPRCFHLYLIIWLNLVSFSTQK